MAESADKPLTITHIFNPKNISPFSGAGGIESVFPQIAAGQAVLGGHHIRFYAASGSEIINYTARMADHYGIRYVLPENPLKDGARIRLLDENGAQRGSLTFYDAGIEPTIPRYNRDEIERSELPAADRRFYRILIKHEQENPSDIVAIHWEWFPNFYLYHSGLSNAVLHAHGAPESFRKALIDGRTGKLQEGLEDLHLHIKNGYLRPDCPVIAPSEPIYKDYKELSGKHLYLVEQGVYLPGAKVNETPADYLLALGRISEEKGIDDAIDIARLANKTLIIAGGHSVAVANEPSREYYEQKIQPGIAVIRRDLPGLLIGKGQEEVEEVKEVIAGVEAKVRRERAQRKAAGEKNPDGTEIEVNAPIVIYVGEVDMEQKIPLLEHASALLTPHKVKEAFGMVMIEAMACGTPVVGYGNFFNEKNESRSTGSIAAVIEDGLTGLTIFGKSPTELIENAAQAVGEVIGFDRRAIANRCQERWSLERQVRDSTVVYDQIVRNRAKNLEGAFLERTARSAAGGGIARG